MSNKTKKWLIAGAAVLIIGGASYAVMNNYLGNNVEITQVISSESSAAASATSSTNSGSDPATAVLIGTDQLNGLWSIADGSKVYFSVTTSKETVNFENAAVTGQWNVNASEASSMTGEGSIDLSQTNSGNSQRDGHIQGSDFFNVEQYPNATFTATSFDGIPGEWTEGTAYDLTMHGVLSLREADKEVTFTGKTVYEGGQLKLSGTTVVTFEDFGMENPHSVVLSTENDVRVQLELILTK
ncbi:YceI family protein [Paenibacillus sp. SYP-B4298]|uniref:YceI family protein n=1 Tax=Paenibacillus sp. SYP-B4298 TaxID=2996034 RepID=UPI0022DD5BBF|nr:YceI family protein [Paenibacillus sp. SYP-B4298]